MSISYLLPLSLGGISSIFICSYPLKLFCEVFPTVSSITFCIISIISVFLFIKTNLVFKLTIYKISSFIFGFILSFLLTFMLENYSIVGYENNTIYLLFAGLILAIALVLPAISFSYMLVFLGLYEQTLNAITNYNITFLILLGFGVLLGTFIFAKLFLWLINKYQQETYIFVLGFYIYSLIKIIL